MSIASGFEDSIEWDDHNRMYYPVGMVNQLLDHTRSLEAQNEELKAMLRKHEWSDGYYCPECHVDDLAGHSPDCALAKLLG